MNVWMFFMMFTFGKLVSETDDDRLISLNVYATIDVFDIDEAKRLRRSVIVSLDVNAFSISFTFDVVTGFDLAKSDSLHGVYLR